MSKAAHFQKKEKATPSLKVEKFASNEQKHAPLEYLNKRRMNPTDMHPILSPAVDPFTRDDVDETVLREDTVDRRENIVPVAGRMWRDDD